MILHLQPARACGRSLKSPVLLCVDDSKLALLASAHVLASHGYEVIATDNTDQAIRILLDYFIDAVVTDYEMPNMNGGQFAAYVKSCPSPRPVLLHSGCMGIPAYALRYVDVIAPKGQPIASFLADVESLLAQTFVLNVDLHTHLELAAA
jgi:response regulator RpfG family c-di-GMP phosphodiesterase